MDIREIDTNDFEFYETPSGKMLLWEITPLSLSWSYSELSEEEFEKYKTMENPYEAYKKTLPLPWRWNNGVKEIEFAIDEEGRKYAGVRRINYESM